MKLLFRHILLLAVILGLAGQGVAFASSPCAMMQKEQVSAQAGPMAGAPPMAGMSDCAMSQHQTDPHKSNGGSTPCKDMTPGCFAMAGCAALVAVDSLTPTIEALLLVARLALWPATAVLTGRNVPPELDPPSLLG